MSPFDVVKNVEDAYGKVEESVVEVEVKTGAMCVPYVVRMPLMVAAPWTARSVPGVLVPIPTLPWFVTVKKLEVAKALVVEPMVNRFKAFEVEAAKMETREAGVVVPMPRKPVLESKVKPATPALPKRMVEEACRPAVRRRVVEVELTAVAQLVLGVNGKIAESEDEETLLLKSDQSVELR